MPLSNLRFLVVGVSGWALNEFCYIKNVTQQRDSGRFSRLTDKCQVGSTRSKSGLASPIVLSS